MSAPEPGLVAPTVILGLNPVVVLPIQIDGFGEYELERVLTASLPAGLLLFLQAAVINPTGNLGLASTSVLVISTV